MNDSDISREIGLNSVTGKSYRNILKMMFLTFDVRPWYRNIGKRLVKSPKGYLLDTLLACHILDHDLDDTVKNKPELFGHLLENFVATEIIKQLSNGDTKADFKGIAEFAALTKDDFIGGIVLYSGKDAVPFGKNLWAVPFHVLW